MATSTIQKLHSDISAVCPILGVSVGDSNNKTTWRIDFAPNALAGEIAAANNVVTNSLFIGSDPQGITGSNTLLQVEVFLGNTPVSSGKFTISGLGFIIDKPVNIQQASGPYTGKGTLTDESGMDAVLVRAKVLNDTTIECFWNSFSPVKGNVKFNYFIGA